MSSLKTWLRSYWYVPVASIAVAVLALSMCHPASAQQSLQRPTNFRVIGTVQATAGTTFATTSYADLTGATVTYTPVKDQALAEAPGTPIVVPHLHVIASIDLIKATATTGTCAIFANGAIIANTARVIDFAAKEGTMTLFADITESVTGANQVVKIQCKSGDTNVLTENFGVMYVEEFY